MPCSDHRIYPSVEDTRGLDGCNEKWKDGGKNKRKKIECYSIKHRPPQDKPPQETLGEVISSELTKATTAHFPQSKSQRNSFWK
jgi:hypothetical protein